MNIVRKQKTNHSINEMIEKRRKLFENKSEEKKDYNLSSERIRQIIDNSLKKIRSYALCD